MSFSAGSRPFPESLCHSCAAPPRYVTSDRGSVFVFCPLLERYPPQPVFACGAYRPPEETRGRPRDDEGTGRT